MSLLPLFAQAAQGDDVGVFLGGGLCILFTVALSLLGFIVWVWALIHAIKNPALDSNEKLIWVLVILFTSLLGALIYFFVGAKKRL